MILSCAICPVATSTLIASLAIIAFAIRSLAK